MSDRGLELVRLQIAVQQAWTAASIVGASSPRIDSPQWKQWQDLIAVAIAAQDAFTAAKNADA